MHLASVLGRCSAAGVLVLAVFAAGCAERVTDTGYLGTWEREVRQGRYSRIAIWEEEGSTYFCWSTRGKSKVEGDFKAWELERVRCAPGGISETVVRREVIYEHRFSVRPGERPGELLIDVNGVPRDEGTTPIQWTDRIVVEPGGMELLSFKVRLNGKAMPPDRAPLRFTKIADVPI